MTAAVLVACGTAGAEPGDPGTPASQGAGARPPGWKPLPSIATAAGDAARADGVAIDRVDAWGEPAVGCYAVWLTLHGGAAGAPALAEQVLGSFNAAGGSGQGISLGELARPSGPEGVLAFAFTRPPYHGRVRAHLGNGRIAATACFGNQREPLACDRACARVLDGGSQEAPGTARGKAS